MNKYKTISYSEIKQLKIDLIIANSVPSSSNNSTTNETNITDQLKNIKNEQMEKIFKENVREILRENFCSKDNDIDRNIKFREIKFDEKVKIVSLNFPQLIEIDSVSYLFIMKEDGSLTISRGNIMGDHPTVIEKKFNVHIHFGNHVFSISELKNIEMNGAFKIANFNIDSFDRNEILVIYNNVKINEEKPIQYIVIESAFNKASIQDMAIQMKRDKLFLEKMIPKRILYFGIVNIKERDKAIINFDFDCIILGINDTFFGKSITKYYDWESKRDIKSIKSKIGELESRISTVESHVSSVENILNQLVKEFRILNEKFTQFIDKNEKEKEPGPYSVK
jgi:hypothetical protein